MTDFKSLTDLELENEIRLGVADENKANIKVLHLLAEAERRRLYSKNHPSLFEYCVKFLKYSEGSAQRRIDSMRAMKLIPEIESKIMSGELSLMAVSQAQCFFRQEAKSGKGYTIDDKKELLKKLENRSTRDCVKELVAISPESVPQEKRRILTPQKTELKVIMDNKLLSKLDEIKALLSHKNPHMTDLELLEEMADIVISELNPAKEPRIKVKENGKSKSDTNLPPALAVKSQNHGYIPRPLRRAVYQRYNSKCSHAGCSSRYFLEIDHIIPKAIGGKTTLENLRLLCRAHNQRAAIEVFGLKKMSRYINGN